MSMHKQSIGWRLAAILLTVNIVAASCGDDGEDEQPASPETPSEQPADGPDEPAEPTKDPEDAETEEPDADDEATAPEPEATPEPTAAPEPEATPEPTAAPEPVGLAQAGPVTLEFYMVSWLLEYMDPQITAFQEHFPNVAIEPRLFETYDDTFDNYVLAQEQGENPALVNMFEVLTQQSRDTGYFKSVAEAIGGRDEINGFDSTLSDVVPGAANYYKQDGEYFSLPFNSSTALVYANMDLLVEAGVASHVGDTDAIPSTWDDLSTACEAIVSRTGARCAWWLINPWWLEMAMTQMDAELVNNGNGRQERATQINLTSVESLAFHNFWADLAAEGYWVNYGESGDPDADFAAGDLAFISHSSGRLSRYTGVGAENGFAMAPAPLWHNDEIPNAGQTLGGSTIYLADGLDELEEEAALTFMMFLLTADPAADLHKLWGYVPINDRAYDLLVDEGWFEESPNSQAVIDAFSLVQGYSFGTAGPLFGSFRDYRSVWGSAMEDIIINGAPVADTLATAEAEINSLMEEYNLLVG